MTSDVWFKNHVYINSLQLATLNSQVKCSTVFLCDPFFFKVRCIFVVKSLCAVKYFLKLGI